MACSTDFQGDSVKCSVKWHLKEFHSHSVAGRGTNLSRNKHEMQPASADDRQGFKLKLGLLFSLVGT